MSSCCHEKPQEHSHTKKFDYILWGSAVLVTIGYGLHFASEVLPLPTAIQHFNHGVFEYINKMWIGVVLGIVFVGLLNRVPRELVMTVLGRPGSFNGLLRATAAGLLLDLCSHGILLVGMKFYERGASLGQTMAFLIASPWNSLSLTIVMLTLIGFKWTCAFIILSAVMALVSGVIFDHLVKAGSLPKNPNFDDNRPVVPVFKTLGQLVSWRSFTVGNFFGVIKDGVGESRMIVRWLLFGVVLASLTRAFVPVEIFKEYFGPSPIGLAMTLIAATIIEVCSEGSTPIAAEIFNRAGSPGNAFAFLMAGVSTDYTEIMALKEQTRSWKIALFLPLVTLPQVIVLALILNWSA